MHFFTETECEGWLQERKRQKPDTIPGSSSSHVIYPSKPHDIYWYSLHISQSIMFRSPVLLWITEWGIWSSSENWHLYYKLRQSYGDQRLLCDAPGHLFLGHESEDFASFLQLAMLNGWGGYALTQADYVNLFFSHDEYIDFFANNYDLSGIVKEFGIEEPSAGSKTK